MSSSPIQWMGLKWKKGQKLNWTQERNMKGSGILTLTCSTGKGLKSGETAQGMTGIGVKERLKGWED